ncbi:LysR substrate-binding domain-containing protein [Roseibium algae]|uniref:LysR substrate-binding domain-containing protein n=1 Tax=Roseibium algae TaxID=3123038 RepID=A0ABU8TKG4_9HYPH
MRRLPPLTSLPAFEATARLGSMKLAAQELGRTHSAVSKQIAHLTDELGLPFFEKDGVGVALTAEGQQLAAAVSQSLDGLETVWGDMKARAESPVLNIGISATFAMRWLVPRLARFYQREPGVQVNFRMTGRELLPEGEMDAILTWDRLQWDFCEREDIEVVGDVAFGLVHAPGMELTEQGDGFHVPTRFVQDISRGTWKTWEDKAGIRVSAEQTISYPHTFLSLEAAIAGLGAVIAEWRLVEQDVQEGKLLAPFGFLTIADGFGVILPVRGRKRRAVRAFVAWLADEGFMKNIPELRTDP